MKGGDVAGLLAALANLEADLLSIGAHGRSRAAGVLFGSVATAMARHATCSVLIARDTVTDVFPGLIVHASDGSPESLDAAREPVPKVVQGSPHRRIVEVADETGASLVVMGSRGRTGLKALGSVSERVAHRAPCSVLIVRQPAHPSRDDGT